jgi:hypothetical protein
MMIGVLLMIEWGILSFIEACVSILIMIVTGHAADVEMSIGKLLESGVLISYSDNGPPMIVY